MNWTKRQKRLHRQLYMQYRKEELFWYLDVFLSVNHPELAVKKFLADFEDNKNTIRQMFTRVLICGGDLAYSTAIPYEQDMRHLIAFMLYRQYIEVSENMLYSDIMTLPRIFKLSPLQRFELRDTLLQSA